MFISEEWELLKKLRTDPEYKRSALVDSLSVQGVEQTQLVAAQRQCRDLKAAYLGKLAEELGKDPRRELLEAEREDADAFRVTKVDAVVRSLDRYELINRVLVRRVYNMVENSEELRCAVPSGAAASFDFPGRGSTPLGFRERILLEYHNGSLGGHQGRERIAEMIQRDFWWPGLYSDVWRWCAKCEFCRAEKGANGVSAWTRTEMYTCPFRVLQFDTITCRSKHVLTCVCCFSRWVWLVLTENRKAPDIARGLMRIFCDMGSFPAVLRSDNAAEFVSEIIRELSRMLGIRHITRSAYHPQSQGQVESMRKTLNGLVRALVEDEPENWEEALPCAQLLLRSSPMACLGGWSPYEVVTGLKPRLPRALVGALPAEERSVDACVRDLVEHLCETHKSVQRSMLAASERDEHSMAGRLSQELQVGDPVLARREPTVKREGPTRSYPGIFVVKKKISPTTLVVEDLVDKSFVPSFTQPLHAERLIKLDMPVLDLQPNQPRRLEMREKVTDEWSEYVIDRFGADGRVRVSVPDGRAQDSKWVDLTKCEYRWLA